jgi:4-amino-4-deoxy-L-arabinose transferase-like glycosyltransferase
MATGVSEEPRRVDQATATGPIGEARAILDGLPPAWHAALWALVLAVLAAGLFLPDLMYSDAPQDAVMALRMFREGDWSHLLRDGQDYLDKPHLLFWSAMAGYRLFGVHDWSYRLLSVLVSLLGAYSAGRLGRRLYSARAGQMAALLFITAQHILLSDHDVRMEALLTGFTAFGLWQLVRWADTGQLRSALAGAAGIGLAVGTKGMVAAALSGLCLVLYLAGRGKLRALLSWHVLAGVAVFFLVLAPVLAAYWIQFDLHPEKVIEGRTGVSGVRFILLGQSAERFSGGQGTAASHDYLFFFHTLLWAFLPWSPLLYTAWGARLRALWRGRLEAFRAVEQLTFLGPLTFVAVLNLSAFKLPHYLNLTYPLLAVLVAGWADGLARAGAARGLRVLTRIQDVLIAGAVLLAVVLNGWSFPVRAPWILAAALPFAAALVLALRLRDPLQRLWVPSAVAILLVNWFLNASFFPQLSRLQPGSAFARQVAQLPIDRSRVYFLGAEHYQPFQFYTGTIIRAVEPERLRAIVADGRPAWALVSDQGREALTRAGLEVRPIADSPSCRITHITAPMLDPARRGSYCPRAWLVEVRGG